MNYSQVTVPLCIRRTKGVRRVRDRRWTERKKDDEVEDVKLVRLVVFPAEKGKKRNSVFVAL